MPLWLFPRPCYCHLWLLLLEVLQHPPCDPLPPSPIPGLNCDSCCLSREENNLWMLHLEFGLEQCHRMEGARICFPSTIFGLSSGRVNPVSQSPSRMNPSNSGDLGDAQVALFVRPFSPFWLYNGTPFFPKQSCEWSGFAQIKLSIFPRLTCSALRSEKLSTGSGHLAFLSFFVNSSDSRVYFKD